MADASDFVGVIADDNRRLRAEAVERASAHTDELKAARAEADAIRNEVRRRDWIISALMERAGLDRLEVAHRDVQWGTVLHVEYREEDWSFLVLRNSPDRP